MGGSKMYRQFLTLVFLGLLTSSTQQSMRTGSQNNGAEVGSNVIKIMDSFKEDYDKRIRPNYGGDPVVVGITLYVISITSISEVNMDFSINLYLRQAWNDPRLKFKGPNGIHTISVGSSFLETLWQPDTFIVNEKKSEYHLIPSPNEFVRISEKGDVLRSSRLTLTASCPMNLQYFPMDRQLCTLEFESYGYQMNDIRYTWAKGHESVGIAQHVPVPQFTVVGHRQRKMEISLSTGNYSRLAFEIQFARSMGYYIVQTYFPSCLIVIISWMAFYMDRTSKGILGRVALGVTTVLTQMMIWMANYSTLPKISYIKAIDVYLGFCLLSLFVSLLESVMVGYASKSDHLQQNAKPEGNVCGVVVSTLDKWCRICIPVLFIIFNLMYWITYIHISDIDVDDLVLMGSPQSFTT